MMDIRTLHRGGRAPRETTGRHRAADIAVGARLPGAHSPADRRIAEARHCRLDAKRGGRGTQS